MLHAVVMAGGSGTRFWPQSRRAFPKQFLRIGTARTLIQETVDRCLPFIDERRIWVVTGASHAAETQRQLPELSVDRILAEPCPRNTAPCIGLAAIRLLAVDPDAVMLVVPADHIIFPNDEFQAAVERAAAIVESSPESFVLFGVSPTYPATGFGYIQRNPAATESGGVSHVRAFKEKPDLATAEAYLAEGNYLWNCGIFVWKARAILNALATFQPETSSRLNRLSQTIGTSQWDEALAAEFPGMTATSIDYAVLEQSANVCVLPASFGWDDVGSWHALSRRIPDDTDANTVDGLHVGVETRNCILRGAPDHLIATFGVSDLIIVQTPSVTLVADRRDEGAVKLLLAEVQRRGLEVYL